MAETGLFRTGWRGFKKRDVLAYIDELQQTDLQKFNEVKAQCDTAVQEAQNNKQECEREALRAQEAENRLQEAQSRLERMTALAKTYKHELLALREKVSGAEAKYDNLERETASQRERWNAVQEELRGLREDNEVMRQDLARQQAGSVDRRDYEAVQVKLSQAQRENERYAAAVGDVGEMMLEARRISRSLTESAAREGKSCFLLLEQAVTALEQCVKEGRESLSSARRDFDGQCDAALNKEPEKPADKRFF